MLGILVDEMVYYQDTPSFYRISTIVLITVMFMCVLYFLIYAQHQYLMSMYTYDIRKDIFDHWQHMEPQLINDSSSGEVLTLLQSYAPECFYFVIRNIVHRTAIIIAHKLSSVMLCDNIAVIENGAVVSYGKSDDIIQQSRKIS